MTYRPIPLRPPCAPLGRAAAAALAAALLAAAPACDATGGWTPGDDPAEPVPVTPPLHGALRLTVEPPMATLTVTAGTPATARFRVMAAYADGALRDVTLHVPLRLENPLLGRLSGGRFTSAPALGGRTRLLVEASGLRASADITVKVTRVVADGVLPAGSAQAFARARPAAGAGPVILYPPAGVLLPPNLGGLELMWRDATSDVWEVRLASGTSELRVYTARTRYTISPADWRMLANSNREAQVTLTVRGMKRAGPATARASSPRPIAIAREDVRGGLYYWTTTTEGVVRYDFGKAGQKAETFFAGRGAGKARCVGCHALSRDGKRMAVRHGDETASILDVKTRKVAASHTYKANFQVFTPDARRLVTSYLGVITLRDARLGSPLATLDTRGGATMPDLSPDGKQLAWVRPIVFDRVKTIFTGASILRAPLAGNQLGRASVLVAGSATSTNFYPTHSPDGRWIAFNRTRGVYDLHPPASLLVVPAAGGPAIRLARAGAGDATVRDAWPRWAPFRQTYRGRPLYWITFSSTRDYGSRLVNHTRAPKDRVRQLWMAAFDPARAAAGGDPSFPAFRLPFQDIRTNNHIAQWVEQVVRPD